MCVTASSTGAGYQLRSVWARHASSQLRERMIGIDQVSGVEVNHRRLELTLQRSALFV